MASGFKVASGADLDSVFAPLQSGWPQAPACGYTTDEVDLHLRYAKLTSGSAAAATGFRDSANNDLNTYFAAAGSTGVQVGVQPSNVSGSSAAGYPSGTVTSGAASCAGAKGGGSYTYTWHTTGCTATSPSSSSSTFYVTVDAASTDDASAYCTISDGVTSVNTNMISVTLQNTSPAAYVGTLVAGHDAVGEATFTGYYPAYSVGSLEPTSDINGHSIGYVAYITATDTAGVAVALGGFESDPGQDYFTTLLINGVTYPSSSAIYYPLGSGGPQWNWPNSNPFTEGDSYTIEIEYPS